MSDAPQPAVAGTVPWLPPALARFAWWSTPVRAEYLAVVRIGLAVTLLFDQLRQYLPCLDGLYGRDSTGASAIWRSSADAATWRWSLFYGFDQPQIHSLALALLFGLTLWLAIRLLTCAPVPADKHDLSDEFRLLLIGWLIAGVVSVLGTWAGGPAAGPIHPVPWLLPAVLFGVAGSLLAVRWIRFRRADLWFIIAGVIAMGLLLFGVALASWEGLRRAFAESLSGWADNSELLHIAFGAWVLFTLCLGVGLCSRVSAVITWVLAVSFANLNPLANHGEVTVRNIILFYLMLAPCGAAWSLDRLPWRRRQDATPVYVSPWALRLLLIQLALIYCFTGLYKALGEQWQNGDALYYAVADLYYARMSLEQLGLPLEPLRWMTWIILVWEITFPLWVLVPWTRAAVLMSGIFFHLGTLVLLDLGGFEWYMFVLYLPLLPWARWLRDPGYPVTQPVPATANASGNPLARWIGLFVVGQLIFLGAANLSGFVLTASEQLDPDASTTEDGFGLALVRKVSRVCEFWGDVTEQRQAWIMYEDIPAVVDLAYIEVRCAGAASPPGSCIHILPADHQPDDIHRFFRFGGIQRYSHVEEYVVPPLSDAGDGPEATDAEWASEIADFVLEKEVLLRNYIAYRVRHWHARHPNLPEPEQAILHLRRYRTNPPGSPTIWDGPEDVPIARWLPSVADPTQSLQAYNPATRQFCTIHEAVSERQTRKAR